MLFLSAEEIHYVTLAESGRQEGRQRGGWGKAPGYRRLCPQQSFSSVRSPLVLSHGGCVAASLVLVLSPPLPLAEPVYGW